MNLDTIIKKQIEIAGTLLRTSNLKTESGLEFQFSSNCTEGHCDGWQVFRPHETLVCKRVYCWFNQRFSKAIFQVHFPPNNLLQPEYIYLHLFPNIAAAEANQVYMLQIPPESQLNSESEGCAFGEDAVYFTVNRVTGYICIEVGDNEATTSKLVAGDARFNQFLIQKDFPSSQECFEWKLLLPTGNLPIEFVIFRHQGTLDLKFQIRYGICVLYQECSDIATGTAIIQWLLGLEPDSQFCVKLDRNILVRYPKQQTVYSDAAWMTPDELRSNLTFGWVVYQNLKI